MNQQRLLVAVLASAFCVAGCATGSHATDGDTAAASVPGNARSGEGRDCDFGGSSDFTCTQGLTCCYADDADDDSYGTCRVECD